MTAYYTQAQIDEIGALIGQEILNSNEALKQFVQDKIAALEPVTPPAPTEPEAGDGTTPAPAVGMFLGDGREIKCKLITFDVAGSFTPVEHGIDEASVLSIEVSLLLVDRIYKPDFTSAGGSPDLSGYYKADYYNKHIYLNRIPSELYNAQGRALITYLA